jgi:hypothetical protein
MDLPTFEKVTARFFERAVVSISYSAAASLSQQGQGTSISLVAVCVLLLLMRAPKNDCIEATFSILVSRLFISTCMPPLHDDALIPAVLLYLVLCALLCETVRSTWKDITRQWDLIVPYVVVFSTTRVLQGFRQHRQMHFVYLGAMCYLMWGQNRDDSHSYLWQFLRSIVSRGIVLVADEYVLGKIYRVDLALSFFYLCLLVSAYVLVPPAAAKQLELCLGVIMYALCTRLIQSLQSYCSGHVLATLAVTVSVMVAILHQNRLGSSATELCINSLNIMWGSLVRSWVARFYGPWEPLFMYLILFFLLQGTKDLVASVLHTSALVYAGRSRDTEIVLIATEEANHNSAQPH